MASPTTSALQVKLEEQLTCSVCLDLYTNPRTLPCLHSFCQQCLENLPQDPQGDLYFISCPTCRHRTQLPKQGTTGFPVAFQLNNLQEIYNLFKKMSNTQELKCDNCGIANAASHCKECEQFLCQECIDMHNKWSRFVNHKITGLDEVASSAMKLLPPPSKEVTTNCSSHHKPLEIFCEQCELLICHDCIVRVHKDHDYDLVAESYTKHRTRLESKRKPFCEQIHAVSNVITALTNRENEIKEQGEAVEEEIHTMVEQVIDLLHQTKRQLIREVDTVIGCKLQQLSQQKEMAEASLRELNDNDDFIRQQLKESSPQQFLMSLKKVMECIVKQVNIDALQPSEVANIQFFKDSSVFDGVSHIGDVVFYSPKCIQKCTVKKIDHTQLMKKGKIPLSLQFLDSSLLSVPLASLSCSIEPVATGKPVTTVITNTAHPGVYTIHCQSMINGRHQIIVRVNDIDIGSTSMMIPFSPYVDNISPVFIVPELLNKPFGIAIMSNKDGCILVTERDGKCVTMLDKNRKKVKSIGEGGAKVKFNFPRGLAITPDNNILVADYNRIQMISLEGNCLKIVNELGPLESIYSWDVAVSPVNGLIYVTDYGNHRIVILNSDLTYFSHFGRKGSAKGDFDKPKRIAIDKEGLVYVTDFNNHRVQVFTPNGQFLSTFGTQGSAPGQLYLPEGIVINNDLVYIAESGTHRVSIFTTEGHFVRCFGEKGSGETQFICPNGVTLDSEGRLYICDYNNYRLVVY